MSALVTNIHACREAIENLLIVDQYDSVTFNLLWNAYQSALDIYCESSVDVDPDVLQSELDFVQHAIDHITAERTLISRQLISCYQGRKAIDEYGRFPAE